MAINDAKHFYPKSAKEWRKWLEKNHEREDAVWVIFYKKSAGQPGITWSEAVDEALCFGWIDSIKRKLDEERSIQFFSKRKPKSTWSKINKAKVEQLIAAGKMRPAGLVCIDIAKGNGSWDVLNAVEELEVPKDLEQAFKRHKGAKLYFDGLSKSVKKMMLQWLALAKREETRQKRVEELASMAAEGKRPKQFGGS